MLVNPQPFEQTVEAVGLGNVIICLQHADKQTLAETARTNQKQIVPRILQQWKIRSFVRVIQILVSYVLESCHTVRDFFYLCHNH